MTLTVDEVLQLYEEVLKNQSATKNSDCPVTALETIRGAYKALSRNEDGDLINYNEAKYRYAYIYYYAVCHTVVVTRQFARILIQTTSESYCNLMGYGKEELDICSLGGGPGCDLIGLLRMRSALGLGATKKINCTVVDVSSGWQHSMKNVFSAFLNSSEGSFYRKMIRLELIKANLTVFPPRLSVLKRIATTDILTLVKFVSAVPGEDTSTILESIFGRLKRGAYVFFLDNGRGNSYQTTESAAINAGLLQICPVMYVKEDLTSSKKKLSSIGPFKMKLRPLKLTFICSAVWQKP